MFTLEFTGSATRVQGIEWMDNFTLGDEVTIKMGYAGNLDTVMIGEITTLEPEFTSDRPPGLTVRGYDRRHRLQRGCKTRTFLKKTDSDIASQIASEAGLTANVKSSKVVHEYVLQANQTDLEFLQHRARQIDYEVFVEDKTLFFRPVANTGSQILTLSFEKDLLEFYPRMSTMQIQSQVTVQGWNPKNKEIIVGKAAKESVATKMGGNKSGVEVSQSAFGTASNFISDRPVMSQGEADQLAQGKLNRQVLGFISGEGVCWGRTDLQPGNVIKLDDLGKNFSGLYYVTNVIHRYRSDRGYYTYFTVQRNAI
jgi:phage protein D